MWRRGRGFLPIVLSGGLVMTAVSVFAASAPAARPDIPGNEIRFPVFQGNSMTSKTGRASSPPEIPFSIVDEVPGKSPGAVSGSWITIFEIDLTPIGAGELDNAGSTRGEPNPPEESE